jgi:prepilin-type N-terminal cleavage/methylation domain-containing protein
MEKMKSEKGISLIETLAAMVILGIIAVAFLSALATTSTARATNEERTAAKILAETIMENVKTENYTSSYTGKRHWRKERQYSENIRLHPSPQS